LPGTKVYVICTYNKCSDTLPTNIFSFASLIFVIGFVYDVLYSQTWTGWLAELWLSVCQCPCWRLKLRHILICVLQFGPLLQNEKKYIFVYSKHNFSFLLHLNMTNSLCPLLNFSVNWNKFIELNCPLYIIQLPCNYNGIQIWFRTIAL
jgi:hypothetical protein